MEKYQEKTDKLNKDFIEFMKKNKNKNKNAINNINTSSIVPFTKNIIDKTFNKQNPFNRV